jgi:hypothetical protein
MLHLCNTPKTQAENTHGMRYAICIISATTAERTKKDLKVFKHAADKRLRAANNKRGAYET